MNIFTHTYIYVYILKAPTIPYYILKFGLTSLWHHFVILNPCHLIQAPLKHTFLYFSVFTLFLK